MAVLRGDLRHTRARRPAATATKTKVIRERAEAKAGIARARSDAAEARRAAKRAAAKLERAEATISTLRGERRELRGERRELRAKRDEAARERARADDRLASAEASLAAAQLGIEDLRDRETVVSLPAPETAVVERARAEADDAAARAAEAEERAACAERRYAELAHAATGEARRLTATEIESLRADGPAGPAVLADAIGELARARKDNNPHRLRKALSHVASAAISWKERL